MMIPARPTTYRGIPMRSRLEASHAARLDNLGLTWEYEPRAFGGRRGQYLPDFVIEVLDTHVYHEVRPTIARGFLAMSRMAVIWESEPDALLMVVVPGIGVWHGRRDGSWRWISE